MAWWVWTLLGLSLLVAELLVPTGFALLLFGAAAIMLSAVFPLFGIEEAGFQWIVFSFVSAGLLVTVRNRMLKKNDEQRLKGGKEIPGELVVITTEIPAAGEGRGELRGTAWRVKNTGNTPLLAGNRYPVERVEGLTLIVSAS
jgi:membrane protein implicated in regulation of membrane protease activity